MTCPNCGKEIDEGSLFCPMCGTELAIVPEFVPEIELSIEESMAEVVTELSDEVQTETNDPVDGNETETADDLGDTVDLSAANDLGDTVDLSSTIDLSATDEVEEDDPELLAIMDEEDSMVRHMSRKLSLIYVGALGLLLTCLAIFLVVMIYRDNSASYQVKKGDKAYSAGSYKQAVTYYERAIELKPENIEYRTRLADCYVTMDNVDMAVEVYKDMIVFDPNSTLAYAQVISLYEGIGAYDAIDDFLEHYGNDNIRQAFVDYLAYPPVFSVESGSYDSALILTLTSETKGTIYYTDDGSEPGEGGNVYSEPLYLKKGRHLIKAFFKNEYGVCSSVKSCEYDVLAEAPSEPVVNLDSGDYDKPQLVRIIVPSDCNVYYTLDGSDPNRSSRIYGEPIPVSDGITRLKVVAINSKGVASDIIEREYKVTVTTSFTPEMGLMWLYEHLAQIGYIKDNQGGSELYPGNFTYMYSEMRYIGGRSLYCYNEYYILGTGVKSMTSNVFGMDCVTGEVFLVKKGSNDSYSISPF